MHGLAPKVRWTRLARTAMVGMQELIIDEQTKVAELGWDVGDEILITGTDFGTSTSEVKTIRSIHEGGNRIRLTEALEHTHLGESSTHVNYCC